MILDKQNTFSAAQAITVTAASTNIVDLGNDDSLVQAINEKGQIDVLVQVQTAFAGGTSLTISFQTDDDSAFGSPTTVFSTAAILTATLALGYQIPFAVPVTINEQYCRLYYTISGTMSAGALDAHIVLQRQTNGLR